VAMSAVVIGTCKVSAFTYVTVLYDPLTDTFDVGLKPVPINVSVKADPPVNAELGLRLVSVSGAATVLKLAKTSVSSVAVKLVGVVVPVKSKVQPAKVHACGVVVGVAV